MRNLYMIRYNTILHITHNITNTLVLLTIANETRASDFGLSAFQYDFQCDNPVNRNFAHFKSNLNILIAM